MWLDPRRLSLPAPPPSSVFDLLSDAPPNDTTSVSGVSQGHSLDLSGKLDAVEEKSAGEGNFGLEMDHIGGAIR